MRQSICYLAAGRIAFASVAFLSVSGCMTGLQNYQGPAAPASARNTVTIHASKDHVWRRLIPELGKQFFLINTLDKDSGLISISYVGDPEQYVDCGRITSYVKNARGARTYEFPAASAQQAYEVMSNGLFVVDRRMSLEGRANIVVSESNRREASVTVSTRYVVTRTLTERDVMGHSQSTSSTISFNAGQAGAFPSSANLQVQCVPTGKLEEQILGLVGEL